MTIDGIRTILFLKESNLDESSSRKSPHRKTENQENGWSAVQNSGTREVERENRIATDSIESFGQAQGVLAKIIEALDAGDRQAFEAHTGKPVNLHIV
jgi:hypothetical protein